MGTGEIIFWAMLASGALALICYIFFTLGKEAGCETHEFRVYKVRCIKCERTEDRFSKKIVETRDKNAPTPTQ